MNLSLLLSQLFNGLQTGSIYALGHEKSCVKLRGPSRKAKYSRETDSEPVP